MKKIVAVLMVAGLITGFSVGCGGEGPSAGTEEGQVRPAMAIEDGHKKFARYQMKCPICGQKPISEKFYVDMDNGRIYFDRKKCRDTFKKDPQKHLKQWQQKRRQQAPTGPGAGQQG